MPSPERVNVLRGSASRHSEFQANANRSREIASWGSPSRKTGPRLFSVRKGKGHIRARIQAWRSRDLSVHRQKVSRAVKK